MWCFGSALRLGDVDQEIKPVSCDGGKKTPGQAREDSEHLASRRPLLSVPPTAESSELQASPCVPIAVAVLAAASPGGPPSPHFAPFLGQTSGCHSADLADLPLC